MIKKIASVCCIFIIIVILITPPIKGEINVFPNFSFSETFIYQLDLDGNYELYTFTRFKNLDCDYNWTQNDVMSLPMYASTYSDEQPLVTMVTMGDIHANYTIRDYNAFLLPDKTYRHEYAIDFHPPYPIAFNKHDILTIRTKSRINNSTFSLGNSQNFVIPRLPLPVDLPQCEEFKSHITRVNLPNDPYYWAETLDTAPKEDYRSPFGRGESLEWWFDERDNETDYIIVSFRVHPDPLKKSLDEATKESEKSGKRSVGLGVLSIAIVIILEVVIPKFKKRKSKSK